MSYAIVTGASAGIGSAFAREFARRGYNLFLVARRKDKLEQLAEEIIKSKGVAVHVLAADLNDPKTPTAIHKESQAKKMRVGAVVNNAGFALNDDFCAVEWSEHAREIQVMLTSVTELCHHFLPEMLAAGKGHIINVSSLAAFLPPRSGDLYTPIKAYILSLSKALHAAYSGKGVTVTASCPGFTRSEFHQQMGTAEELSRLPEFFWQSADDVAKASVDAAMQGKAHIITGWPNKLMAGTLHFMPDPVKESFSKNSEILFE